MTNELKFGIRLFYAFVAVFTLTFIGANIVQTRQAGRGSGVGDGRVLTRNGGAIPPGEGYPNVEIQWPQGHR